MSSPYVWLPFVAAKCCVIRVARRRVGECVLKAALCARFVHVYVLETVTLDNTAAAQLRKLRSLFYRRDNHSILRAGC